MKSEWNFDDTIRGTIKGAPVSLDMEEFEVPTDWANVQVEVEPSEIGTVRPKKVDIEKPVTERGLAGRALVDDVVLPAVQKVSSRPNRLTIARHDCQY